MHPPTQRQLRLQETTIEPPLEASNIPKSDGNGGSFTGYTRRSANHESLKNGLGLGIGFGVLLVVFGGFLVFRKKAKGKKMLTQEGDQGLPSQALPDQGLSVLFYSDTTTNHFLLCLSEKGKKTRQPVVEALSKWVERCRE